MGLKKHTWADIIAGLFSLLAVIVSIYEIIRHVRYNHHKQIGKYIIRILLMVPIYVFESYVGVLVPKIAVYLHTLRDLYEAIAVYSFYQLLINTLGGFRIVSKSLQNNHNKPFPHIRPFNCCCPPWTFNDDVGIMRNDAAMMINEYNKLNSVDNLENNDKIHHKNEDNTGIINESKEAPLLNNEKSKKDDKKSKLLRKISAKIPPSFKYHNPRSNPFFRNCSIGVLQYCFVQSCSAIIIFILQHCNLYCDGSFQPTVGYPYFALILSISQTWAIYCLVLFYYAVKNIHNNNDQCYMQFLHMKAVSKFLCIKGVVFFTYWQSVGIALLVYIGIIHDITEFWSAENISNSLQDFLICIEMFGFSVAHHYAFNPNDFNMNQVQKELYNKNVLQKGNINSNNNDNFSAYSLGSAIIDSLNVTDIVTNAKDVVDFQAPKIGLGYLKRNKKQDNSNENTNEINHESNVMTTEMEDVSKSKNSNIEQNVNYNDVFDERL